MIYHFRDLDERTEEHTHAILIDEEGRTEKLGASDFELRSETEWTSPKTGTTYPSTWTIRVPSADIDVRLTPLIEDQELDTRGTTMVVYWEGCCSITGAKGGRPVSGKAYAELVGYDKTHNLRIDSFFFGSKLDWVKQFTSGIFSET